ncbi:YcxB family protein [Glaciecola siphonariae]|uniref:YcxB family protein n=1 Tax=Glaciecola siphonariae TaxID=521012 RepID=A0ABV9LQ04_9ALTE
MTSPFSYSTTYKLDKSHFSETFDESTSAKQPASAYYKATGLVVFGLVILLMTPLSAYAAWFIIVLGIVEALGVYFRKPWWLARQMISRAANTQLTLTIDEQGVSSESESVQSQILWIDVNALEKTSRGWMLHHGKVKSYVSSRCLSSEAEDFMHTKADLIQQQVQIDAKP